MKQPFISVCEIVGPSNLRWSKIEIPPPPVQKLYEPSMGSKFTRCFKPEMVAKNIKWSITFTTKLPKLHFIVFVKKIKFYFFASNTRFVSGFQTCTRQIVLPHSTFIANQHPVTTSSVEWYISAWMGYDFTSCYFFVFLRLKCLIQFYKHFMFNRKKAISILFRW